MRATRRVLQCAKQGTEGSNASQSFIDRFESLKGELVKRVRGEDSSRMLDPKVFRPTAKYGELNLPTNLGPLNKEEEFNSFQRQDRQMTTFKIFVPACPEVPQGPEPYYQRVYKPFSDVLERLFPTDFARPGPEVAEGNVIAIQAPPLNEYFDAHDEDDSPWRGHGSYRSDFKREAVEPRYSVDQKPTSAQNQQLL